MVNVFNKISKISIYLLVFLLPLFFLPWTVSVLDFNKQLLLILLVFISLLCWLLKSLQEGKINLNFSLLNLAIIVFLVVLAASTLFSSYKYGSFWGWPLNVASSFLTISGFILLYFLIINIFQKKGEIFGLLFTLALSSFLAVLFGGFQLFGKFFIPFDFAKISSFNTIGTVNSLGIFVALLLPLIISLIFISKRLVKVLLIIFGLVDLALIFLVNFWVAWIVLLIGMAAILIFGIARREIFQTGWLTLSMFLLVLSLCFGIFRISIPGLPTTPLEVSPSQKTTFNITTQTLKESIPALFLGSGPSTFVYDYSKFKPETINQTAFWGVRFSSGASEILDKLSTTGLLGLISFLGILGVFFWLASKRLMKKVAKGDSFWVLGLGIFASWLATAAGLFFYPVNLSLGFLFWIFTASFIVFGGYKIKSWELNPSSLANIGASFIFIFILILGIGIFFLAGQRYIAEVRYSQGIEAQRAGNSQASMNYLLSAISHTGGSQDNYWRDFSQVCLFRINEELQKKDVSPEELSQIVNPLVGDAVDSAKQATDVAPANVANWVVRGFVYRQVRNLISGADEWAIKSYEEAAKLEPTNPYIYTELGQVYFTIGDTEQAKEQFQRALGLNEDYSNARYFLGLIYDKEGKKSQAIEEFEKIARLNPDNAEVKKILANLRGGKTALEGITPTQPPIEEETPEKLE